MCSQSHSYTHTHQVGVIFSPFIRRVFPMKLVARQRTKRRERRGREEKNRRNRKKNKKKNESTYVRVEQCSIDEQLYEEARKGQEEEEKVEAVEETFSLFFLSHTVCVCECV